VLLPLIGIHGVQSGAVNARRTQRHKFTTFNPFTDAISQTLNLEL